MLLGHFDDNSIPPSDTFYDLHLYASDISMKNEDSSSADFTSSECNLQFVAFLLGLE